MQNNQPSAAILEQWVTNLQGGYRKPSSDYQLNLHRHSICQSPARFLRSGIARGVSVQSDDASSLCSSVESILEMRKPDPEAILMDLGFGPPHTESFFGRIPQRFLQPSKLLTNISVDKFLQQNSTEDLRYFQHDMSVPCSPARARPTM